MCSLAIFKKELRRMFEFAFRCIQGGKPLELGRNFACDASGSLLLDSWHLLCHRSYKL